MLLSYTCETTPRLIEDDVFDFTEPDLAEDGLGFNGGVWFTEQGVFDLIECDLTEADLAGFNGAT